MISPSDARKRKIEQEDHVKVITRRGEAYFYSNITEKVLPGTVEVNQGGGNPVQVKAGEKGMSITLQILRIEITYLAFQF